jgi:hypothetical protein
MSNGSRNLIFNNQDYYRLFPKGIPRKNYQPRQLYSYEIRTLKAILRNPLLEDALQNDFGKRPLNNTEINALKIILCTHKERPPIIDKIFEETLVPITRTLPKEQVEIQTITEVERFPYLDTEQYHRTQHQALEASANRSNFYAIDLQELEYLDDNQAFRSNNRLSNYSNWCKIETWHGNIDIDRFWFESHISDVDNVNSLQSTYDLYGHKDTTQYDSFYYQLDKSGYQEITTHLTPNATEREYGRVFFNTETRYTPLYFSSYRYRPQYVRGYSIRKNRKIYGPRYVKQRILYQHNYDGSILKKPTIQGNIVNRFLRYLEYTRDDNDRVPRSYDSSSPRRNLPNLNVPPTNDGPTLTPSPYGPVSVIYHPPREGYIARTLYQEIQRQHLLHDYTTWVNQSQGVVHRLANYSYSRILSEDPWPRDTYPFFDYYNRSRDLQDQIDSVLQTSFSCRYSAKRIQRKYRAYKQAQQIRYFNKLQNLGTTRFVTDPGPGRQIIRIRTGFNLKYNLNEYMIV